MKCWKSRSRWLFVLLTFSCVNKHRGNSIKKGLQLFFLVFKNSVTDFSEQLVNDAKKIIIVVTREVHLQTILRCVWRGSIGKEDTLLRTLIESRHQTVDWCYHCKVGSPIISSVKGIRAKLMQKWSTSARAEKLPYQKLVFNLFRF